MVLGKMKETAEAYLGGDLLRGEALISLPRAGVDLDVGLGLLLDHLEGVELDVGLDRLIRPLPADQSLGVEHGVLGVTGQLVLGSISDQSLTLSGEGHVAGRDPVALVVGDDLHAAVLEDPDTAVGGSRSIPMTVPTSASFSS